MPVGQSFRRTSRPVFLAPGNHFDPDQVLFRPCAMCVPDLRLISEIMLIAEGFLEAR